MLQLIIFFVLSIPVIWISWRALFSLKNHGFYRFLSWECILWLVSCNYLFWFKNPFRPYQLLSWIFLTISAYVVLAGVLQMKRKGKAIGTRNDNSLYAFEQTTELVTSGIFRFIRHPLYASLLYLTWGIFFKNTDKILLIVSIASSFFLFITAKMDERECVRYFGEAYIVYKKKSKMFIPYIL